MQRVFHRIEDRYFITSGGLEIGRFRLKKMPYCSAVCILCDVKINEAHRGKGHGKAVVEKAISEAKALNYSRIVATVVHNNTPMLRCFKGWKKVDKYYNPKTGNTVVFVSYRINYWFNLKILKWII